MSSGRKGKLSQHPGDVLHVPDFHDRPFTIRYMSMYAKLHGTPYLARSIKRNADLRRKTTRQESYGELRSPFYERPRPTSEPRRNLL
jgi:hypothetical protein